jgi:hypothetical protein
MEAETNMMASTNYCNECGASNPSQATYCFACNNALHTPALSPLSHVQAASINATVLEGKAIGPLIPSYLLHSRYSIVSQVGTGGFGAVYKAKDTLFNHRLVAIKEMNQDSLSSRELAEATTAFEREALLLSDLTHPNLPCIHEHFSEHGRSYVVMDYIAGDTPEDYLDKVVQRLPVEMVLEIGIQLSTVLDYLHNHQPPIIFRDVKPANIMRTTDNHRYIASVSHDIQIFDNFSGKPIYTYTKHSGGSAGSAVQAVAWSPNGRYIASGGMEGTVQVWNARL